MSSLDQIVYRAPSGPDEKILQAGTSLTDPAAGEAWLQRLEPWLRAGGPRGRGYLDTGRSAALIHWGQTASSEAAWQFAHVFIAHSSVLTGRYALLMATQPGAAASLPSPARLRAMETSQVLLSEPRETEQRARSKGAIELMVPLLARVLAGEQDVTMPLTQRRVADAVIWGLLSILEMLGDTQPVSFLTWAFGRAPEPGGLLVSFRPSAAALPPDPGFETVARGLATGYADGPAELRRTLGQHGVPQAPDSSCRIGLLLDLWPGPHPAAASVRPAANDAVVTSPTMPARATDRTPATGDDQVICPICLTPIENWDALSRYRWDSREQAYVELKIPPAVTGPLRKEMELDSYRRCPDYFGEMPDNEHHLPADYGNFGDPVILGFVGLTASGKTHLLATMVAAMKASLRQYGLSWRALDRALHKKFEDERIRPLLGENKVLPDTPEGVVTFADAFLLHQGRDKPRPVVLFDIAGGDLADMDRRKKFLGIVNGLFYIVDPSQIEASGTGDATFDSVLDHLKYTGRLEDEVSAAIVLTKADLVRFEDPITRWLRSDSGVLDADEFLLESRDVYAYLRGKGADLWTLPYEESARATLHVASPTGAASARIGEIACYPRGVSPLRVLRPMIAMLAMTGVLTGPEAEKVGM